MDLRLSGVSGHLSGRACVSSPVTLGSVASAERGTTPVDVAIGRPPAAGGSSLEVIALAGLAPRCLTATCRT